VDHNIVIDAAWLPEQDDTVRAAETAWARAFLEALEPHRAGVYVNFLDSDDDTSRVREAYGEGTYRRLAEVKARYDPQNVFHNNKNIQPSTPAQVNAHRINLVSRTPDATGISRVRRTSDEISPAPSSE
jgi:hypothetical protein